MRVILLANLPSRLVEWTWPSWLIAWDWSVQRACCCLGTSPRRFSLSTFTLRSSKEARRQGLNALLPHLRMLYSYPSLAVFPHEQDGFKAWFNVAGVTQGCALGMLAWCLSTLSALRVVRRLHPSVVCVAYADDPGFSGPPDEVLDALTTFTDRMAMNHSRMSPHKFQCLHMADLGAAERARLSALGVAEDRITHLSSGASSPPAGLPRVLGVPLGSESWESEQAVEQVELADVVFRRVANVQHPQHAFAGVCLENSITCSVALMPQLRVMRPRLENRKSKPPFNPSWVLNFLITSGSNPRFRSLRSAVG